MTDGATQIMNIQQSNLSSSSVNPTMFSEGGGVRKYGKGGLFGESAKLEYVDDAFASDELKSELQEKLGISSNDLGDNVVISFAYTDYGGDFLDKVAIRYFQENYPENTLVENAGYNGENAYVFGEPAKEWIESTEDYPLGFENIEELYYEMQNESEYESFEYYLDDLQKYDGYVFDKDEVMSWLMENRGGYYSMTTQGLDFSSSDLTDELVSEGLIRKEEEEFGKGGSIKDVIVYDNGGESLDRYTIFTPDGSVYGMSESGGGFNQYLGDDTEVEKGSHLGKRLKSVPKSIEKAVMQRMNDSYAKGGMTEHGLRVGDEIMGESKDLNAVFVKNDDEWHNVFLDKGKRFGNGGGVGKLSKEQALKMAMNMGVDFEKDFHAQSYGNELSELAKKVGYRKSSSASGSLGRQFFYHLQKIYDKKKFGNGGGVEGKKYKVINKRDKNYGEVGVNVYEWKKDKSGVLYTSLQFPNGSVSTYSTREVEPFEHYDNRFSEGGGVDSEETYYIIFNEGGSYNKRDAVLYRDDLSEKDAYEIANELNESFPSPTDEKLYYVEKASDSRFNYGNINKRFLDSLDNSYKQSILRNIANHYGISVVDAEKEVTDVSSELLEDYITNQSLRMQVRSDRRNRRYSKGGGVNTGRSWKLDRARHNKSENYEIPMNRRKKAHGGTIEERMRMRRGM